ncbi:hypothetical protein MBLNU230_g4983t1 [Neophaeotheca triangularis]
MPSKTAYITGGASGIGRAVAELLASKGITVALADQNLPGARGVANNLPTTSGQTYIALETDVTSWESQHAAFKSALDQLGGRIDYVYPIAGINERRFVPNDGGKGSGDFVKPDLKVLEVDLEGLMFTMALAIQQMRRQGRDESGFRGKIVTVASVCGFYCVPTLPVYTAAKHATVGFVRSYGKYLPEEHITLNAICPNVVRTNISTGTFYDSLEAQKLLTPMKGVVDAFESLLDSDVSGECLEAGPSGGFTRRAPAEYLDDTSKEVCDKLYHRGRPLHEVVEQ